MADTAIEWTNKVWNPTTGCDRVSPGCGLPLDDGTEHGDCYALTLAKRLRGMGSAKYQNDGDPNTSGPGFLASEHPESLGEPLRWRKPAKVFVNSMSDLFHDRISDDFILKVWGVMARTPQHTYQILTKRHARMRAFVSRLAFHAPTTEQRHEGIIGRVPYLVSTPEANASLGAVCPLDNVWLGVSVENQKWADLRIPKLLETPAAIRFLSCEPLLGLIDLGAIRQGNATTDALLGEVWQDGVIGQEPGITGRVEWVIVGGESGPNFLPPDPAWVRSIRDQCEQAGVPFLFKQWGGPTPKAGGRMLDGRTWDEYPEVSR